MENAELNFKVAVKYNEQGTNCPRIKHIVTVFNSLHYESAYELLNYNNGCLEKNSFYKCCSIDYMCDERYYEDYISQPSLHEGDYQTIYDEFYNGTEILVLKSPAITLAKKIIGRLVAIANKIFAINSATQFKINKGFLPTLSDKFPQKGDTKNWKKENNPKATVTIKTEPPKLLITNGKVATKTPLKATTSKKRKIINLNITSQKEFF